MRGAGAALSIAACLLAGCDRAARSDNPYPAKLKLVAPVASPASPPAAASPSAEPSPSPTPSLSPSPSPTPAVSPTPSDTASPSEAAAPPTPASRPAVEASYRPKDECDGLPGFAAFRSKLAAAVRKRDADALVGLTAPDARLDFGGGSGRDELKKRLGDKPALWGELAEALRLGCAADSGLATLPWIFARMPEGVDAAKTMLVAAGDVPLRRRPAVPSVFNGQVGWRLVVPVGAFDAKARYTEVETPDHALRGFVETATLRSLLDYRVVADSKGGGWAITAFTAGD